jgi:hypothetical protein
MNRIKIECIHTIPSGDATLIGKVCKRKQREYGPLIWNVFGILRHLQT